MNNDALGEVIEASTRQFVAEVYEEAKALDFGSWVRVEFPDAPHSPPPLFGLVSHVETGSYDTNRQAAALGLSPEERAQEMPMVDELLRTTVRAQMLACKGPDGSLRQTLPPHPSTFTTSCIRAPTSRSGRSARPTISCAPLSNIPIRPCRSTTSSWRCSVASMRLNVGERGGREPLVQAGRALSRLLDDDHECLQPSSGACCSPKGGRSERPAA